MVKHPKHSSHWDDDDPPAHEKAAHHEKAAAHEKPVAQEAPVPPTMVKVKCITHLHPWAEYRYLELDEETDVSETAADILLERGFVELVAPPEPPPEARK
jgi:hypothetical protein